jgi:starvation-inducible DNA-binding protein
MNFASQVDIEIAPILKKTGNQIVADRMNDLLSDYNIFYQNVKGFHWNFKGSDYFDFHRKFEDLYGKLHLDINKLAVQIALIGYEPLHSYSDFLKNSIHKEITGPNTNGECLSNVIEGLKNLIFSNRMAAIEADEAEEMSTGKILRQFAFELENELWVFTMLAKY